jgi:hypothetical protein
MPMLPRTGVAIRYLVAGGCGKVRHEFPSTFFHPAWIKRLDNGMKAAIPASDPAADVAFLEGDPCSIP